MTARTKTNKSADLSRLMDEEFEKAPEKEESDNGTADPHIDRLKSIQEVNREVRDLINKFEKTGFTLEELKRKP